MDEAERLTEQELREREKIIQEQLREREVNQTPAWLKIVDSLAGGDRTRWSFYFDMDVLEGLNAYSFEMEKRRENSKDLEASAKNGFESYVSTALRIILFNR